MDTSVSPAWTLASRQMTSLLANWIDMDVAFALNSAYAGFFCQTAGAGTKNENAMEKIIDKSEVKSAEKTPEEIAFEERKKHRAELSAMLQAYQDSLPKDGKHFTMDEMLDLWHKERATGEGLEELCGIKPTSTPV